MGRSDRRSSPLRFVRFLLLCLGALAVVALLGFAVVSSPTAQTWFLQRWGLPWLLSGHPDIHASVDSASATLSGVTVEGLRVEYRGDVLTAPTVSARLPLIRSLRTRRLLIRRLVAQGWTLTLQATPVPDKRPGAAPESGKPVAANATAPAPTQPRPEPGAADAGPAPASVAATRLFRGLLSRWSFPPAAAITAATLEGDVILPPTDGAQPVHVALEGGTLAAGQTAKFTINAHSTFANPALPFSTLAAHGNATVRITSAGTFTHAGFSGTLATDGIALPDDLVVSAGVSRDGPDGAETGALQFQRDDRQLALLVAGYDPATARFSGTVKLDLGPSDLAIWQRNPRVPLTAMAGELHFRADRVLRNIRATGNLTAAAQDWAVLSPALTPLGPLTLRTRFDVTQEGGSLQVSELRVFVVPPAASGLAGPTSTPTDVPAGTVATIGATQRFRIDEHTHAITLSHPAADWLHLTITHLPLASLPALPTGLRFGTGAATGTFGIRLAGGRVTVRPKAPLIAQQVSLRNSGGEVAQGLDLSATLTAEHSAGHGWDIAAKPLAVGARGRRLFTFEGRLSSVPDAYGRLPASGTWTANLDALTALASSPGLRFIRGRSASGTFSAFIGSAADLTGKITVTGHDPANTATATVAISVDDYRSASLHIPLKLSLAGKTADLTVDGTCVADPGARRVDLRVNATKLTLEDVRLLAGALPLQPAQPQPPGEAGTTPARRQPFWGDLVGRIRFDCDQLMADQHEFDEVGGTLELEHDRLQLRGGRADYNPVRVATLRRDRMDNTPIEPRSMITLEGIIRFNAAESPAYRLEATAGIDGMDARRLFGAAARGQDPLIEGRWTVADTISGAAANLRELIARRHEVLRLTSNAGMLRLLKTNVAASLPEPATPVADTVANVGSAVGWFFGVKPKPATAHLNPVTDAVLNFSYDVGDIGYNHLSLTATREASGRIDLANIEVDAREERLVGSGEIAAAPDQPVLARPLHLSLRLGVRGIPASRLAKTNLLSPGQDAQGYREFREPLQFGGTLTKIDRSGWTALLARAAKGNAETPKR